MPEFDHGPVPLSAAIQVVGKGNIQSYVILFGSYNNETEPPVIRALNIEVLSNKTLQIGVSKKNLMFMLLLMLSSLL